MADANWTVTGNGEIDSTQNFLGTTNEQPLVIKTNGIEAMRINPGRLQRVNGFTSSIGDIGIGTDQPKARLHVRSSGDFDHPQIEITQTNPSDFARLRFLTVARTGAGMLTDRLWDIAATDRLNFFKQGAGNIMTLETAFDQHTRSLLPRVGIGTENPSSTLQVNGSTTTEVLQVHGRATVGILEITGGNDLAEPFQIDGTLPVEPGTVMAIDEQHPGRLRVSDRPNDHRVAGIVSGAGSKKPGLTIGKDLGDHTFVALAGCVYCKAEAHSNSIRAGDLLTTSGVSGHAMKAVEPSACPGAILGKALSSLEDGNGLVLVLVNLH